MQQAAALRREIEAKLSARIPGALSPRPAQAIRLLSSGIASVDRLLSGGLPTGAITEVTGPASSGRTALVFSVLAQISGEGACAYIDVENRFDPKSAAAAGIRLSQLLWVSFAGMKARAAIRGRRNAKPQDEAETPWTRLDRALRATDLVLQAGGFRLVVLDMGDIRSEHAMRVPLATWYRFRRAAEESDTLLLLLTKEPCAKSSAACVLRCSSVLDGVLHASAQVLRGFSQEAEVLRQRHAEDAFAPGKKKSPGRAVQWASQAPWACGGDH